MKMKVSKDQERETGHMTRVRSSRWLGVSWFTASPEQVQTAAFWILIVTAVLVAIVAVGNWQLYSRVERIETTLGLRGTQQ